MQIWLLNPQMYGQRHCTRLTTSNSVFVEKNKEQPISGCEAVCSGSRSHMYNFIQRGLCLPCFRVSGNPCPGHLVDRRLSCREVPATLQNTTDPDSNHRQHIFLTWLQNYPELRQFSKLCLKLKKGGGMPSNTHDIIKSLFNSITKITDTKIALELSFRIHIDFGIGPLS